MCSASWALIGARAPAVTGAEWECSFIDLEQIENWEKEDPDEVHEMPEEAGDFDAVNVAVGIALPQARARTPDVENDNRTTEHVQAVEGGEREINSEVSAMAGNEGGEARDLGRFDFDFWMLMTGSFASGMRHFFR